MLPWLTDGPRFVHLIFNGMFSDLHCIYTGLTEEPAFNQIGEHGFQWDVLRSSLYIYRAYSRTCF